MYPPSYHRVDDRATVLAFMRAHAFVALVTHGEAGLLATHLPVAVEEEGERVRLSSHMAKVNPQWRDFEGGAEAMVIFSGPHAYVSPRHYERSESVPTWNYAVVHAYGAPRIVDDPAEKHAMQARLIADYDAPYLARFPELSQSYMDKMLAGIVSFTIDVTRLDARFKISREKLPVEQARIRSTLESSGDTAAVEIAHLMRAHSKE